MNESETRAELIDPLLKSSGWGVVQGSRILREYRITEGRILGGGEKAKPEIADYILVYKNQKLAVIEAKAVDHPATEGVGQAKHYANKLQINYTYSTNGREIYQISMKTGKEGIVQGFPTPDQLWKMTHQEANQWKDKFSSIPIEGGFNHRYYQEIAINRALDAIADNKQRILLTLATGTGKTVIAFQIVWKLFQTRWTLQRDGARRPRILFLADRNILANQAFNKFSSFQEDALVRITPDDIRKTGKVPMSGSVFFTIFQTFMSGPDDTPYFGDYPKDFFDLVIIDECHRGGSNDESRWRDIMEYFSPAVQLGLTATPKREDNIDTYKYFGEPVYVYSLKEGINDGYLTPFRVKRIKTTIDDYIYAPDDEVLEGEVDVNKIYTESDFNRIIAIREREAKRVQIFLKSMNQSEKTIVFCANQPHALEIRDLVNQYKISKDPFYCVRVTANDGALGEQYLRDFQDNEKTIPTILTTSQKLSTGVDAHNIRNIVLMRPINTMIEFKQIIGRGTRLFDGKDYFTIYDFVDAYHHFLDPEWDGTPEPRPDDDSDVIDPPEIPEPPEKPDSDGEKPGRRPMTIIKLKNGKERQIQHMISTSFWSADGKPISIQEFIDNLLGAMPDFCKSEEELRIIWSVPKTRKEFLDKIAERGYAKKDLEILQKLINAEQCDLLDVLSYISFMTEPITRTQRVEQTREIILQGMTEQQKEFIDFVLAKYQATGVDELSEERLPDLLNLKYNAIGNATNTLGSVTDIRSVFLGLQQDLYSSSNQPPV